MKEYKVGQKVKYVGSNFPKYTGKVYRISSVLGGGLVSLSTSEKVRLEGSLSTWGIAFLAEFDEVEELEE